MMAGPPPGFVLDNDTPAANAGPPPGFKIDEGPSTTSAPMSWADVPGQAASNLGTSAGQFLSDMAQPFIHPVATAQNLGNVALGTAEKVRDYPAVAGALSTVSPTAGAMLSALPPGQAHEVYPEAIGKFFADRYGGIENVKHTLANDPVGFAADLSTVLSGGETALGRAPGIIGKVGEVAGTLGRVADPLSIPAKAAELGAKPIAQGIGLMTHTGAEPLIQAGRAGYEGGDAAKAFRENLTGTAPMEDTVADAQSALGKMRAQRGDAYRAQMAKLGTDKTILSWNDVDTALDEMDKVKTYKGQSLSPSTEAVRSDIRNEVDKWKNLKAGDFWTAEGFDALKQKIGDIRDGTQFGTPARVVANQAYNAIRKTIVDQVPEYGKIMKGYEDASFQLKEIQRTLSLPQDRRTGATIDTALRKLQSTLRDNVNTSFGRRAELADYLVRNGAPNLMYRLAGQALKPVVPRGLGRLGAQLAAHAGAAAFGAGAVGTGAGAAIAATLPFMSPRLMGEAAYLSGKASRLPRSAPQAAFQVGRATNPYAFGP